MNDRFKFRAWHKPTKKMFEVHCFTDEQVFENTLDGVGTSPTNPANMNDCVLMQCTGLKDSNGLLIYEGDVVIEKRFQTETAVIKFGNGSGFQCFYPGWLGKYSKETKYNPGFRKDLYYWLNKTEGLKVIGNIHENPELLEDK